MTDTEVVEAIANVDKRHTEVSSTKSTLFSVISSSISQPLSPETSEPSPPSGENGSDLAAPTDRELGWTSPSPSSAGETCHSDHAMDSPRPIDATPTIVDDVIHSPLFLARNGSSVFEANPPSSLISYAPGSVLESGVADVGIPNNIWAMPNGYDAVLGALAAPLSTSDPPPALNTDESTQLASSSRSDRFNRPIERRQLSEVSHLRHDYLLCLDRSLLLSFSAQATATILLHHYMENMVYLMQPVSHRSNPFKNIYLTAALAGSRDLASPQMSPAAVSVYHSVLASAAINLQGSSPERVGCLHQAACYHRREALKAARSALDSRQCGYKAAMTAILSLVSVDVSVTGPSFLDRL